MAKKERVDKERVTVRMTTEFLQEINEYCEQYGITRNSFILSTLMEKMHDVDKNRAA